MLPRKLVLKFFVKMKCEAHLQQNAFILRNLRLLFVFQHTQRYVFIFIVLHICTYIPLCFHIHKLLCIRPHSSTTVSAVLSFHYLNAMNCRFWLTRSSAWSCQHLHTMKPNIMVTIRTASSKHKLIPKANCLVFGGNKSFCSTSSHIYLLKRDKQWKRHKNAQNNSANQRASVKIVLSWFYKKLYSLGSQKEISRLWEKHADKVVCLRERESVCALLFEIVRVCVCACLVWWPLSWRFKKKGMSSGPNTPFRY